MSMRRIEDEHRGLLTVISLTQEQLEEIGSDKLPSFLWDPGVHFVITMFMLTQVAPEIHTLHLGLVWSGSAGTCYMGRDPFLPLDNYDTAWRCLDRYFFYRDAYTDTVFRQQVQWSQVF
jgi:hypothetical protein